MKRDDSGRVKSPLGDIQKEGDDMEADDTSGLIGATGDAANMVCAEPSDSALPHFMPMFGDFLPQFSFGGCNGRETRVQQVDAMPEKEEPSR